MTPEPNPAASDQDARPISQDDLPAGSPLLDGHYTIERFLGAGGFGITYLARDNVDRLVVIKECFPNLVCSRAGSKVRPRTRKYAEAFQGFVSSFLEEARALAKLAHPNIVHVHQVFEDNGTAYMAMDYIDGQDLEDRITSKAGSFSPHEVVAMLERMLSAVDYSHGVGVLHRDISPENILIDRTGKPVLIDFGEATQQLTPTSRVITERFVVKNGYSPQELYLIGAEQTAATDLYALGATFYHVISGQLPPSSQQRMAALAMQEPDPCTPLTGRFPGYPPGFLESIDAAMEVFQKDRLQSAAEWIDLLHGSSLAAPGGVWSASTATEAASTRPAMPTAGAPVLVLAAGVVAVLVLAVVWLMRG